MVCVFTCMHTCLYGTELVHSSGPLCVCVCVCVCVHVHVCILIVYTQFPLGGPVGGPLGGPLDAVPAQSSLIHT